MSSDIERDSTLRELRGHVFRHLRSLSNATQDELGDIVGISGSYLRAIEAGDKPGSGKVQANLAAALGVDAVDVDAAAEALLPHLEQVRESGLSRELVSDVVAPTLLPDADYAELARHVRDVLPVTPPQPAEPQPRLEVAAPPPPMSRPSATPASSLLLEALAEYGHGFESDPSQLSETMSALAFEMAGAARDSGGTSALSAIEPLRVWYLSSSEIAIDGAGSHWANPMSIASTSGNPHHDARVMRRLDGRVLIDMTHVPVRGALGPRDPKRHSLRMEVTHGLPAYLPVDEYLATTLTIGEPDAPVGVVDLTNADDRLKSPREFGLDVDMLVTVTAYNPGSELLAPKLNQAANAMLRDDLDAAGLRHVPVAGTPSDPDNKWEGEPGFGVLLDDPERISEVVDLAREYGQNGVFVWDKTGWSLLLTFAQEDPLQIS